MFFEEEPALHSPTMTALEFPRIQQELAAFAACQIGKELALTTAPLASLTLIRHAQQETTEAKAIVESGRSVPFGGIQDVRLHVERAAIGGVLRPDQLIAVADTIYGCRQLYRFLTEHQSSAPLIARHAAAFGRFDDAEEEIRRCIERGAVSSRASRTLKQVRSEIAVLEGRIQERLNGILRQVRQHLQDPLVTARNGRYVVPVKVSSRAAVPGTVHGASASGSTIFVEPEAVRQIADELETWRAMEAAEMEQVLATLSGIVAAHADGLQATLGAVGELDLVFARARLSQAWAARPVTWNEAGLIDLKGARHPLLGRAASGNRIRLTLDSRMLIVTGPNTGGKTLLLKTLGLLVVIARSGMHIPVDDGSTLCLFDEVFADIGDQQSLEQSLSTFSGHIANVAPMLTRAGAGTLILLDELGSGTDPHEGTGLGIALLEAFLARGAYVLATTHLRDIKEFGRLTPGCAIAGMGFDGETLQPTYRLVYGTLGESHGLEIAARVGLPAAVVERARVLVYGADAPTLTLPAVVTPVREEDAAPDTAPEPAPVPPPSSGSDPRTLPLVVEAVSRSRCQLWNGEAERITTVRDTVRRNLPAGLVAGDRVRLRDGQAVEAANRRNFLVSRDADTGAETIVAANLDRLLIIVSARQPDFHSTMLARHLFYAESHGVTPVICLTKSDLVAIDAADDWLNPFRAIGYEGVAVSAVKSRGIAHLTETLAGKVTAVMGNPGAGKTTLLGALTGATQPNSQKPRALHLAPDSWLIDMPGLRALGVWKPNLSAGLHEFTPYLGLCAHAGCLHRQESGCAVRLAADTGAISRRRYDQYLALLQQMRLA